MIYSYGITQIGTYHIEHNIVCQDAHYIKKLSDSCVIAAVADGLGSEMYTDVASKAASQTAVEVCAEKYSPDMDDSAVIDLIRQAFRTALYRIEEIASENGHEITQYDTTLDLVIYTGGRVFFGHAGDSGIVALLSDGTYAKVTQQGRDDMGRVFPLSFEDYWVFGVYEKAAASVFLATDGMLETLFPILLRSQPVDIYVALAQYFMDRELLHFEEVGEATVVEKIGEFISSISGEQVDDDKTVVVLCDEGVEVTRQPDEYYAVPDWKRLEQEHREAYMREAYPHLFKDKGASAAKAEKTPEEEGPQNSAGDSQQQGSDAAGENAPEGSEKAPEKQSSKGPFGKKLFRKRGKNGTP